jgi:gustatory receptor
MFVNFIKINWQFVFNGILAAFRLFGLSPIRIDETPKQKNAFINVILIVWSIFQFLLIGVLTFCVAIKFMHEDSDDFANFNNMLTFSSIVLTHFIIVVESAIVRQNFISIWRNIRAVDALINKMIGEYDVILRNFYKRTAIKVIGFIFMTALLEMGVIFTVLNDRHWTFMWWACIVSLTVSRMRHLQHLLFIDMLAVRFCVIKRELKSIVRLTKLENNQLIAKNYSFYEGLFNKIGSIKKVYNILWESSLLLNKSFGFSQLSNLLQNFVQLTCDLYSMYSFLYVNNLENILGESFALY